MSSSRGEGTLDEDIERETIRKLKFLVQRVIFSASEGRKVRRLHRQVAKSAKHTRNVGFDEGTKPLQHAITLIYEHRVYYENHIRSGSNIPCP